MTAYSQILLEILAADIPAVIPQKDGFLELIGHQYKETTTANYMLIF
jgi:hypothetical protein